MTNRSSCRKHGLHDVSKWTTKSPIHKRNNKEKARNRKVEAVKEWQEMLKG